MRTTGVDDVGDGSKPGVAYKWKVLASVIFGVFMVILDTTAVNVAFQTLRHEFGARLADAQWIISVYVLVLGIATPVAGFLADRFGSKRTYVFGLSAFVGGSLLCGLSPGLGWLIAARGLQGLGGGIALPLGSALLLRAFPTNEQGRALGLFGIALVFAPAMGPILGGILVDAGLWRWIFFINLPIGLFGIVLASRFLREDRTHRDHAMDWPGLVTEIIGFGSLLYAASIAETMGWSSPEVARWFAIGGVALLAFAIIELFVAREPLLDLRLFTRPTFLIASLVGYVTVVALFGAEFLLPVYLQGVRGRGALQAGMILLPMAASAGVATPLAGRLYDRIGPRLLLFTGFSLLVINTWQFAHLDGATPISWICFLLVLRGTALGLTTQTTYVTAMSVVSGPKLARGASLVNAMRNVTQSIGVALLAAVLAGSLSARSRTVNLAAESGETGGICEASTTATTTADGSLVTPELRATACSETIAGFEHAYRLTFWAALIALMLGVWLPGWPGRWRGRTFDAHAPPSGDPDAVTGSD
jgi:EmrB/QacA subfamily drug resistance transporter